MLCDVYLIFCVSIWTTTSNKSNGNLVVGRDKFKVE